MISICEFGQCNFVVFNWIYDYEYIKECVVLDDCFVDGEGEVGSGDFLIIGVFFISGVLQNNNLVDIVYVISDINFNGVEGELNVELVFFIFLVIQFIDFVLVGVLLVSQEVIIDVVNKVKLMYLLFFVGWGLYMFIVLMILDCSMVLNLFCFLIIFLDCLDFCLVGVVNFLSLVVEVVVIVDENCSDIG